MASFGASCGFGSSVARPSGVEPGGQQPLAAPELPARPGELHAVAEEIVGAEAVAAGNVDDVVRVLA